MKDLIDNFVCVRLVKANHLDLTLFQFDYDLTFSVFFMNADKTIYGRFGSRSSVEEATKDMSLPGLAAAMTEVLKLHRGYPANRADLAGKQPQPTKFKSPDDYPSLKGKFSTALDYKGAVTKSCMHCHQVRDAERQMYRDAAKPIPDKIMFPYPMPDVIGLTFDPKASSTIASVTEDSAAATAGLRAGDVVQTMNQQPIVSLADVQWALHHAEAEDSIAVKFRRDNSERSLEIKLAEGWRRNTDISWRVTSWPLRRMGTGGILFEPASSSLRREHGLQKNSLALVAKHVGQYGPHAAAKRAGFKKGDIIVSFNGKRENMSTSQLLAYATSETKPGEKVPVEIIRNGRRRTLQLPMQK